VKLLTLGSGNIKGEFDYRGIREVLEMFIVLRRKYPDIELVVRSDIPRSDRRRYQSIPGLRIIDRVIPRIELEHEFTTADIFVLPCHSTPAYGLMEAMSYELPVVTLKAWANAEFIEDGINGFLVEPSKKIPYYYKDTAHPNFDSAEFRKAIQTPDPQVVGELVQKVSLLIENPELRRKLGKAARDEVESGKLSRAVRNEKLKRIFDEATRAENREKPGAVITSPP
jgi:glycosyltransferase involved in cell wall biosynthesis